MTEQTLDQVVRTLATGMPRRTMIKAVAAAAAGGAGTLLSRWESHAAPDYVRCCREVCPAGGRDSCRKICMQDPVRVGCPPR